MKNRTAVLALILVGIAFLLSFVIVQQSQKVQLYGANAEDETNIPSPACLGSCPTNNPTQEISLTPMTTIPETTEEQGSPTPSVSSAPNEENEEEQPCEDTETNSIQQYKKKIKHHHSNRHDDDRRDNDDDERGGFIERFIRALFQLIEELLSRLGIALPGGGINVPDDDGNDNGDNEETNPPCQSDEEEDNNADENDENTDGETPQPTNTEPTQPSPSGSDPTPTLFNQPSTTPSTGGGNVQVGSKVVFTGDYNTGNFSQWGTCQWKGQNGGCSGVQATGNYIAQIVNDGAGHETAARFEVRSGDEPDFGGERAEVRASNADVKEGDERWYQFQLKFPSDFQNPSGGWFIVMQWHAGSGSPPLALEVNSSGKLVLSNNRTNKKTEIGTIQKGQWMDIVLHVKFSSGSSALAEAYVNGTKAPSHTEPNMASSSNYLKMGIYRGSQSATHVVFHDGLKVTAP